MLSRIVSIQPDAQGGFAPLLAGASAGGFYGSPLLLGYELGGAACGALAADCFNDSITLRWLCVDKSVQRRGIAGALLHELCTQADKAGVQELDAVVTGGAASPIRSLLLDCGFEQLGESPVYHFPLSAILNGPLSALLNRQDAHAVPLRLISAHALRSFNNRIASTGGLHPPSHRPGHIAGGKLCMAGKGRNYSLPPALGVRQRRGNPMDIQPSSKQSGNPVSAGRRSHCAQQTLPSADPHLCHSARSKRGAYCPPSGRQCALHRRRCRPLPPEIRGRYSINTPRFQIFILFCTILGYNRHSEQTAEAEAPQMGDCHENIIL